MYRGDFESKSDPKPSLFEVKRRKLSKRIRTGSKK
jgi:hypothetical protein